MFRWENLTSHLVGWKTHPTILPRSGIEHTTSRTPWLQTWSRRPTPLTTRPWRRFIIYPIIPNMSQFECFRDMMSRYPFISWWFMTAFTLHKLACIFCASFFHSASCAYNPYLHVVISHTSMFLLAIPPCSSLAMHCSCRTCLASVACHVSWTWWIPEDIHHPFARSL